jgi:hypothetical protein
MMVTRSQLLWSSALIITLASAYYQRATGPTWPVHGHVAVGLQDVGFKLPRSHEGERDARVAILVPDATIQGDVKYRRTDGPDAWDQRSLVRQGDTLIGVLPHQPPAQKLTYQIFLRSPGSALVPLTAGPITIRFKGYTPLMVLLPHIILMFGAMLFSTQAGLAAVFRGRQIARLAFWTVVMLFFGGLVLGPIVVKYAFDAWWTGWPVGNDLTDNKTAIAFLLWLIAWLRVRKHPRRRIAVIVAAVLLLAVYLIPHSAQ